MTKSVCRVDMNANRALRRICATLAIGACMLVTAQAQELSFTLHEQLIIGDDEEAPSEYLLHYPQIVRTDSQGNIYVKDARSADVRVFDANGRYVTTVGKRGEGPGELQEVFGMHVDGDDRVIVADRMSRRLTIFTDMGKSFTTKSLAEDGRTIAPRPILSLDNSFVLKYVKLFANPEGGPSI
ncbi:MAG: 6-bladed beta-propeller, partial [Rhodothermaceae bacterium]|nr:6-bladed beta-propeller [Rhodothermaceae bacterium]